MNTVRLVGARTLSAVIVLGLMALPAPAQQAAPPHWTYEGEHGPSHWAALDPAYKACGVGKEQSPIDIRGAKAADLPPITFSYQPSPLKIVDNGHTVQITFAPGSFITVGDRKYELQQAHFHHPSEERVNGKSFPMVAHLVHKGADGKLAVVAVLLTGGNPNDFVGHVWKHMPREEGQESSPKGVSVDLTALLPATRGYFTFAGSLTTPPCSEGVTWLVLKTPVSLSQSQIAAFSKKYPHNARPVQPLNGRTIQMTK